jgi:hypothetical protein
MQKKSHEAWKFPANITGTICKNKMNGFIGRPLKIIVEPYF